MTNSAEERAKEVLDKIRSRGTIEEELWIEMVANALAAHAQQAREEALRFAAGAECRWCKGDEAWEKKPYKSNGLAYEFGEWRHRAKDESLAHQFCSAWLLHNALMESNK